MNKHPAFGTDRRAYSEWFVEACQKDPYKTHLLQTHGEVYYNKVLEIYKERLAKNDFNIGPQSEAEWKELRESLK